MRLALLYSILTVGSTLVVSLPYPARHAAPNGATPAPQLWHHQQRATTPRLAAAATTKQAKRATPWGTLLKLCKPDVPLLITAFVSLTIAASGDALLPALQGAALNTALGLETQTHSSLRTALIQLVGVGIGTAIFTGLRGFAFWLCGARLVARLRATLFEALLSQPQAFHDDQGPGELSSRLATDCVKLGGAPPPSRALARLHTVLALCPGSISLLQPTLCAD